MVLSIFTIIYIFYWRRKQQQQQQQQPVECCSSDSTCTDLENGSHDSQHEAEQVFQSFTTFIAQQSNVPTGTITETEEDLISEELLEEYTIHVTPYQPIVQTGQTTETEEETITEEVLEEDTIHVTPYQPIVQTGQTTELEEETITEVVEKDTIHVTSCQPIVQTGQTTETEIEPITEEILKKDTVFVTSYQPKVKTVPITNAELQAFTEELLQKDTNNVAPMLRINHQGRTNSRDTNDKAEDPLLTVPSAALKGPTIRAFLRLLNNYDANVAAKEVVSKIEIQENIHFLNEIMKTQVMKHTESFLYSRGIIQRPLKNVLKEIWFTMYSRAGRNDGSSGFEHVFIGEIKNEKVSGFHNWIQFGHEEWDGDLDYKGIMRYINLGNRGQVIKGRFDWMNESKPVGTLFVGTSPEFEMALYTVCFLVKPDKKCQVKLNNKKFNIQTHSLAWNHKLIGGAFPDI